MTQLTCSFLNHLTPSQLTRLLAKHTQAKVIWLNNADKTDAEKDAENEPSSVGVIGIFPKVSWTAYPTNNKNSLTGNPKDCFIIHKTENSKTEHHKTDTSRKSYQEWTDELVTYCKAQTKDNHSKSVKTGGYNDGLMGFIGYDMAAHALSNEVSIKPNQPCAYLGHYDVYLTCTIAKKPQQNYYTWQLNASSKNASDKLQQIFDWLKNLKHKVDEHSITTPLPLTPVWQFSDYEQAFNKTQTYLHAGDCYQINLTQAWVGKLSNGDANNGNLLVDYLPKLHANTNAPFAGYLQTNDIKQNNFELVSCSPELFFTFKKENNNHVIITKPIKGTRPRGENKQTDQQLKYELANSEKDLAENVMIVDLLRNDLGKFAKVGTVKVPKRFEIESYSNVHHMVSTISATLKADTHPLAVLFGSLPAGSVTGTPKKRVVEIIHELEAKTSTIEGISSLERGAYCGTMGYLNFDGTGQWNVLIRTLQCSDNTVSLWAGGGITVASDCKAEYQECLDKVGNLIEILHQ